MSSETLEAKPLYYWPKHADISILKSAFEEVRPPFKVKPYPWQPGHPGRVVVLSSDFPYVFDHAFVKNHSTAVAALKWALGLQLYERGPKLMEDTLKDIFGEDTVEVTDADD